MEWSFHAFAGGFDPNHPDLLILHERIEHADRIAAAAHCGDQQIRQPAFGFQNLAPRLIPDNPLEIADHHRIRMRAHSRTQHVEGVFHVADPVSECLIPSVLQCP
ncbi:hypothetical protein D3C75_918000 [compost metagenome]